jgi:Methylase involved in ubiquinone/menaquinone biosynthesis
MINRKEVGKRIKEMRIKKLYSQEELGNILNISAQAISKWEIGKSLPDIEVILNLSKVFKVSINEILEGSNTISEIINRPAIVQNGLYMLADEKNILRDDAWEMQMVAENWIEQNWNYHKNNTSEHKQIAQRINKKKGQVLEIGTGPGGGFMPAVLLNNAFANIIISDICPTVVQEWKKYLAENHSYPNLQFVVGDNCKLPFSDNSIDVVSSRGGIGNTIGSKIKAIKEVYRVLKPGGLFVSSEGFVTRETLALFDDDVQRILKEKRPDIFEDYYEATVSAGFKTIDTILGSDWSTKDDESDIADLAKQLGVEIVFTGYLRYCIK